MITVLSWCLEDLLCSRWNFLFLSAYDMHCRSGSGNVDCYGDGWHKKLTRCSVCWHLSSVYVPSSRPWTHTLCMPRQPLFLLQCPVQCWVGQTDYELRSLLATGSHSLMLHSNTLTSNYTV